MTRRRAWIAAGALAVWAAPLGAQSFRARLDARGQAVSYRDLIADSILATSAVPSPSGGFQTPDGHAVRCSDSAYCYYSRPGDELRGVPVSASGSVILWGLGVPGLTIHATGRLVADLGPDNAWPATEPTGQLIEGFVEYRRPSLIARGGRLLLASRLEPLGFDGASVEGRWRDASIEFGGYAGWGLGRAAVVPVYSPALNPLDEWRPADRQIVVGADAGWHSSDMDARAEYRREIDPRDNNLVSERTVLSLGAQMASFHAAGSIDYNIAEGRVGNADATLTYTRPRLSVTGGARRYRPFFSLWSLWSAFSPVPFNAVNASADVRASDRLTLHARGEAYRYENAGVSTALVPNLEDSGWRMSGGGTATLSPRWSVDGNLGFEHGPGASARFADAAVRWEPNAAYSFALHGGALDRPLELRFYDASSLWIGARGERQFGTDYRLWADATLVNDERDRPDASASSLSQFRIRTGVSASFGSSADRLPLPPARPTRR